MGTRSSDARCVVRFCTVFAAVFLVGGWLSGWRYAFSTPLLEKTAIDLDDEIPPMPTISTVEELEVALQSNRFMLFVDVDWSPTAVMGRRVVFPLVRSWRPLHGANRVSFFRLDVTDPDEAMWERLRAIPGIHWLSGAGELLLHRDGETIIVNCAATEGSVRLRERLNQLSED